MNRSAMLAVVIGMTCLCRLAADDPEPTGSGTVVFKFSLPPSVTVADGSIELVEADSETPGKTDYSPTSGVRLAVAPGKYVASNSFLAVTSATGEQWSATFSLSQPVVVTPGKETLITLGTPIAIDVVADAEPLSRSAGTRLWVKLTGVGGEAYEDIAVRYSRMVPSVRLTSSDGVVVAEADMEYG